jgi:transcriptional regulator with XRE-family HTH domain
MRRLLAAHDIAGVYAILHRYGVSQRAIAARTGQAQSEISEIMAGSRQVHAYDVLLRIADGLGVARGWMGLAYDETTLPFTPGGEL